MKSLLVVGASARAAASSIVRAGWQPSAADMFCDSDLRALCNCVQLSPYPDGAKQLFAEATADAWMYVGGLENHPKLVGNLARQLPLLGNSCDVLEAVRNPWRVAAVLHAHGISVPQLVPPGRVPQSGRWLCKPVRSCGGTGVFDWTADAEKPPGGRFFQERIDGQVIGAIFVGDAIHSQLIGATRHLVGTDWLGARGYMYSGSIGPLKLDEGIRQQLHRIGAALTAAFRLRGIFGVDAVLATHDVWPIEINPRYTASVEVLERALDVSIVRAHVQACRHQLRPLVSPERPPRCSGKAVFYAPQDVVVSSELLEFIESTNSASEWPLIADIPRRAELVAGGRPLVSLLAEGPDDRQVVRHLQRLARSIDVLL